MKAFICGIDGINVGSVAKVVTMARDQLGTATITAGSGITVTPTANTITIAASGGGSVTLTGNTGGALTSGSFTLTTGGGNANGTGLIAGSGTTFTFKTSDANGNAAWGVNSLGGGVLTGGASSNSCFGLDAGEFISSATNNSFFGAAAGEGIVGTPMTSSSNVGVGVNALTALTTGSGNNVAIGASAGQSMVTGSYSTLIGSSAGLNYGTSDSSNIVIGANITVTGGTSNRMTIGAGTGTGNGQINLTKISGIQGITVTGTAVLVSATDQLGIAVSSGRFKNDIQTMTTESDALYQLRPVSFVVDRESAPGLADAPTERQLGLIAEEVYKLFPSLVGLDKDVQPLSVNYGNFTSLLINEIQKLNTRIAALEAKCQKD